MCIANFANPEKVKKNFAYKKFKNQPNFYFTKIVIQVKLKMVVLPFFKVVIIIVIMIININKDFSLRFWKVKKWNKFVIWMNTFICRFFFSLSLSPHNHNTNLMMCVVNYCRMRCKSSPIKRPRFMVNRKCYLLMEVFKREKLN